MAPHHEFEKVDDSGVIFTNFHCHSLERSCRIKYGDDFDYCPFCGDQLPESEL